jgi:two-component system phosphate regulon sensor histidine kinase PhoR
MVELLLGLLLGLAVGLVLWKWQQSHSTRRIKMLLGHLKSNNSDSSLPFTSQLSLEIARLQRYQQQLEQQIENYRQALHTAPIGYLQVDDENRLIWCNPQARELLGIEQDQFSKLPRLLLELVRSYELDHLIEQTRSANQLCCKDWTFFPVSSDPSRLSQQQPYAVRGYGLPLTQGQVGLFLESRQEAVMLIQQRDRWASDVAHELKTPLTSIRLVAETLQSRLDPSLQNWIERLINETIRLSNLVQDLLDLSQFDRGSSQYLQLKPVNLRELVESAWMSLEPLAHKKQLHLEYYGPDHLLTQVDEARMHRVLINLLDNSIKYSPSSQSITVKVSLQAPTQDDELDAKEQQVCLEIIDAGPGFPEGALPYVFERFYRVDPARSRWVSLGEPNNFPSLKENIANVTDHNQDYEHDRFVQQHRNSSGLGLAIVKQIVEAHQGCVSANNHPETGGAWLTVYLPWHQTSSL